MADAAERLTNLHVEGQSGDNANREHSHASEYCNVGASDRQFLNNKSYFTVQLNISAGTKITIHKRALAVQTSWNLHVTCTQNLEHSAPSAIVTIRVEIAAAA